MQRYDFLARQIEDCEARVMAEIERLTPPDDPPDGGAPDPAPGTTSDTASSRSAKAATKCTGKEGLQALALRKMMGVDLTAIPTIGPGTALVIASEIGPDFSAFPSAQHFCSWLALAPPTRISGGKNLPGKSPKAVNPVGQALRMAAISPLISNIFLHYVLDEWFEKVVKPRLRGNCQLVRFADDFVVALEDRHSGKRLLDVLGKQLGRYGLTLHETKTRYVDFRRRHPYGRHWMASATTFDFLGFTHV